MVRFTTPRTDISEEEGVLIFFLGAIWFKLVGSSSQIICSILREFEQVIVNDHLYNRLD
jgi:hypothetical protein